MESPQNNCRELDASSRSWSRLIRICATSAFEIAAMVPRN